MDKLLPASISGEPTSLLLVEDVFDHAEVITAIIHERQPRINVTVSATAEDGLKQATEKHYDILLTDYRIGTVECFDLIADIRNRNIDLPIIILTGQGNEEVAAEAIGRGADDYFIKDRVFRNPEMLIKSISSAVERHRLQDALRESEELNRTIVQNIKDGLLVIKDDRISFANPALAEILLLPLERLIDVEVHTFVVEHQKDALATLLRNVWEHGGPMEADFTMTGAPERPEIFTSFKISRSTFDRQPALIGTVKDITKRTIIENRLRETLQLTERLSITDPLTEVYNRRYALQALEKEINRCRRYDNPLSLMMIDLDTFKHINDRFGHLIGDEALITISKILRSELRDSDTIARYGGDEFIIILPETQLSQSAAIAERIRAKSEAKEILTPDEKAVRMSLSIGLAELSDDDDEGSTDLIRKADRCLLLAKDSGRNRVIFNT